MPSPSARGAVELVPQERRDDTDAPINDAERAVLGALRGIAYGQVEIVVHSSRIVQITRSQKLRLDGAA